MSQTLKSDESPKKSINTKYTKSVILMGVKIILEVTRSNLVETVYSLWNMEPSVVWNLIMW